MNAIKNFAKTFVCVAALGLASLLASAQQKAVIIWQGGTAVHQHPTSSVDSITVKEAINVPVTGVTIAPSNPQTLSVSESFTAVATVAPAGATNKAVKWSSSADTVATVTSTGLVTAVAAGTATITVTSDTDNSKTASVTVRVTAAEEPPVPVTGVNISPTDTTLYVGDTFTAVATVAPTEATNKGVTWGSSNSSVATVAAAGLVEAVAPGWAVIIAATADGGKIATIEVTVATPTLSVSPDTISAANTAGAYSIEVTSNTAWTATVTSDNSEWCTLTDASGDGNGTVTVNVTANPQEARTATVAVTAGNLTEEVAVNQEKASPPPPHAASSDTWQYGNLIWSDRINVAGDDCDNKAFARSESAAGGTYSDAGVTRYYYNWHYVDTNKESMCPSPWRVPTSDDFGVILTATTGADLTAAWGFGGRYDSWGSISWYTGFNPQGLLLWSATSDQSDGTKAMNLQVVPGWGTWAVGGDSKMEGRQVRCVRN
jgi:uncharacterized protein YjdB